MSAPAAAPQNVRVRAGRYFAWAVCLESACLLPILAARWLGPRNAFEALGVAPTLLFLFCTPFLVVAAILLGDRREGIIVAARGIGVLWIVVAVLILYGP